MLASGYYRTGERVLALFDRGSLSSPYDRSLSPTSSPYPNIGSLLGMHQQTSPTLSPQQPQSQPQLQPQQRSQLQTHTQTTRHITAPDESMNNGNNNQTPDHHSHQHARTPSSNDSSYHHDRGKAASADEYAATDKSNNGGSHYHTQSYPSDSSLHGRDSSHSRSSQSTSSNPHKRSKPDDTYSSGDGDYSGQELRTSYYDQQQQSQTHQHQQPMFVSTSYQYSNGGDGSWQQTEQQSQSSSHSHQHQHQQQPEQQHSQQQPYQQHQQQAESSSPGGWQDNVHQTPYYPYARHLPPNTSYSERNYQPPPQSQEQQLQNEHMSQQQLLMHQHHQQQQALQQQQQQQYQRQEQLHFEQLHHQQQQHQQHQHQQQQYQQQHHQQQQYQQQQHQQQSLQQQQHRQSALYYQSDPSQQQSSSHLDYAHYSEPQLNYSSQQSTPMSYDYHNSQLQLQKQRPPAQPLQPPLSVSQTYSYPNDAVMEPSGHHWLTQPPEIMPSRSQSNTLHQRTLNDVTPDPSTVSASDPTTGRSISSASIDQPPPTMPQQPSIKTGSSTTSNTAMELNALSLKNESSSIPNRSDLTMNTTLSNTVAPSRPPSTSSSVSSKSSTHTHLHPRGSLAATQPPTVALLQANADHIVEMIRDGAVTNDMWIQEAIGRLQSETIQLQQRMESQTHTSAVQLLPPQSTHGRSQSGITIGPSRAQSHTSSHSQPLPIKSSSAARLTPTTTPITVSTSPTSQSATDIIQSISLHQLHLPILAIDHNGLLTDCNAAFLQLFGLTSVSDITNMTVYTLFHQNEHIKLMLMIKKIMSAEVNSVTMHRRIVKNQSQIVNMAVTLSSVASSNDILAIFTNIPTTTDLESEVTDSVALQTELDRRTTLANTESELREELSAIQSIYETQLKSLQLQQAKYGITQSMIESYSVASPSNTLSPTTSNTSSNTNTSGTSNVPTGKTPPALSGLSKSQLLQLNTLHRANEQLKVLQKSHGEKLAAFMDLLAKHSNINAQHQLQQQQQQQQQLSPQSVASSSPAQSDRRYDHIKQEPASDTSAPTMMSPAISRPLSHSSQQNSSSSSSSPT